MLEIKSRHLTWGGPKPDMYEFCTKKCRSEYSFWIQNLYLSHKYFLKEKLLKINSLQITLVMWWYCQWWFADNVCPFILGVDRLNFPAIFWTNWWWWHFNRHFKLEIHFGLLGTFDPEIKESIFSSIVIIIVKLPVSENYVSLIPAICIIHFEYNTPQFTVFTFHKINYLFVHCTHC